MITDSAADFRVLSRIFQCFYVTFEFQDGSRAELMVPDREFGLIVEGDKGRLSYQGTRFKGFVR
ncbi:DUF2500 domain-containing protein [Paenibacillus sp. S150]|uniref:DUF2500 domain-containing protein n=1 Tax=Paenibacillus sp. S150 TaxID=2749826 RepID=UPI001C59C406|nr:DUF2500 domain-containing protein [Paenibacillus sp. S150]MBW4083991.1 DUF2500 domain-containing protein [Paenibacillus sp. S150]